MDFLYDARVNDRPITPADWPPHDGPDAALPTDQKVPVEALPPPDTTPPDMLSLSELPSSPCGTGSIILIYPSNAMAVCQGGGPKTPCAAGAICASGWHVCTASEYLARGGVTAGTTVEAWLASCIRDGAAPAAPSNQPCSSCKSSATGSLAGVTWTCGGLPQTSQTYLYLSVKTSNACRRLGQPTAPAAMWSFDYATSTIDAVVCCYGSP